MKTLIPRYILAFAFITVAMILGYMGKPFWLLLFILGMAFTNFGRRVKKPSWTGSKKEWALLILIPFATIVFIWLVINGHILQPTEPRPAPEHLSPQMALIGWFLFLSILIFRYRQETKAEQDAAANP